MVKKGRGSSLDDLIDTINAIRVNIGSEETPEYALLITGDLGIELDNLDIGDIVIPFPEGDAKLLEDKTLADIIEDDRLSVKLDTGDVVDVSLLATEATLQSVKDGLKPLTPVESFGVDDLDEDDVYTATGDYERSVFGLSIINKNKEDELTFTIGGVTIPVPPSTSLYDEFNTLDPLEITVEGDDRSFGAYLKG